MNSFNCDLCNKTAFYFCFKCKKYFCFICHDYLNNDHDNKILDILTIKQQLIDKLKKVEKIDYLENKIKEKFDIIINYIIEIKNNLLDEKINLESSYLKKIIDFNDELKKIDNSENFKNLMISNVIFDENNNLNFKQLEEYNDRIKIINYYFFNDNFFFKKLLILSKKLKLTSFLSA